MRLYRDAVQMIVDEIWSSNERLSRKELHRLFYNDLVALGFRAHHAKEIYVYAESMMRSAKDNGGRKPILRKLSARIDKYDYKLDLDSMTLAIKLHNSYEAKTGIIEGEV